MVFVSRPRENQVKTRKLCGRAKGEPEKPMFLLPKGT